MKFYIFLAVTCLLVEVNAQYYGKFIGALKQLTNDYFIAGTVYAADENHLYIENFEHDGKGPGVRFWVGKVNGGADMNAILNNGVALLDENGSDKPIKKYDKKTIYLTLPIGIKFKDVKYFSIWCDTANVNFGHVEIPSNLDVPVKRQLGSFGFSPAKSGVKAEDVILEAIQTILVKKFEFSGGDNVFFGLMSGDYTKPDQVKLATKISDSLLASNQADKLLKLPIGIDVRNFKNFIVYNSQTNEVYGKKDIPSGLNIPPKSSTTTVLPSNEHCKQITDDVAVFYKVDGLDLVVTVDGVLADDNYIAFGISGSSTGTQMVGGDVVAVYMDNGNARAIDYYLSSKAQCSAGKGVCPDNDGATAQNNVELISGKKENGRVKIQYKRKLSTGDNEFDKDISKNQDVQFIWAKGPYNAQKQILYHSERSGFASNLATVKSDCKQTTKPSTAPPKGFEEITISDTTEFEVTLGSSGGEQGYKAITKTNSWGIAYYINGKLIPVLKLNPNVLYTFNILTGNNTDVDPEYHPFYITNDPKGNYRAYDENQRKDIKIYAGLDANGKPIPSALGTYCSYKKKDGVQPKVYDSFPSFSEDLKKVCRHDPPIKGQFKFTPTSDLVGKELYYQCYAHNNLGWKIVVEMLTFAIVPLYYCVICFHVNTSFVANEPFHVKLFRVIPYMVFKRT
ncbi:DgyrCDS9717 [Dimorphilus gyrociliatus]|uniref:DgyrCDS9717 n=1 Tax=Dimorphilus gyrociliatus TaxID=2664684 RepID=A0A7I8VZ71_9ANNE|nr:DgyrCDS9717 [Dimorphilus gyrociliatus]